MPNTSNRDKKGTSAFHRRTPNSILLLNGYTTWSTTTTAGARCGVKWKLLYALCLLSAEGASCSRLKAQLEQFVQLNQHLDLRPRGLLNILVICV